MTPDSNSLLPKMGISENLGLQVYHPRFKNVNGFLSGKTGLLRAVIQKNIFQVIDNNYYFFRRARKTGFGRLL